MLKSIAVRNVRLFGGDQKWRFDLETLTVLCGTNSAGKSTLAKMPLLIRQSHGIGEGSVGTSGFLRLVGSQLDLGTFAGFVSGNDLSKDVSIDVAIEGTIPKAALAALRLWKATGGRSGFAPSEGSEVRVPYLLHTQFTFGLRATAKEKRPKDRKRAAGRSQPPARESLDSRPVLKQARFELFDGEESLLQWQVGLVPDPAHEQPRAPRHEIMMPTLLLRAVGWDNLLDFQDEGGFARFDANVSGILPTGILVKVRAKPTSERSSLPRRITKTVFPLPYAISDATQDLSAALAAIHYIGPLRAPAKRFYVAETAVDHGLDSTGDFLPFVLRDRGEEVVRYGRPNDLEIVSAPLTLALDQWISYLRSGSHEVLASASGEISVSATKQVLVELSLRSSFSGLQHALADSGFGYSQVLPVLVRGLLAPVLSTIIVEQPELHLHPALQVRLAEFFVGLGRAGKQVILETHSEHVVNAMRVITAEEEEKRSRCVVYFLDAPDGQPKVHRLDVKADGTFDEWPRAFFGETAALRGRLLRAQKRLLAPSQGVE